jgi:acetyl esterase/lipase
VRARATEWKLDPHRIGVLGFSAGAHLSAALSTHFDKRVYDRVDTADEQSCRPDFSVLVYPAYISATEDTTDIDPEIRVSAQTPPAFIVQAEDDDSYVASSIAYFEALRKARVPAELHIYAGGGHGYGLRRTDQPVTRWPGLAESWLKTIGMMK